MMLRDFLNSRRASYWADLLSSMLGRTLISAAGSIILAFVLLELNLDLPATVVVVCVAISAVLAPVLTWLAFEANRKIVDLRDRLKAMTTVETLPSVLNNSFFLSFAERLRTMSLRQKRDISMLTVEIMHFDSLQSVFGRRFGETLINRMAGLIVRTIRVESDLVCRLHDTEFAVLLIDANPDIAELIANRLQNAFNHADLGSAIVSARIGVATLQAEDRSIHRVIERARATRFLPQDAQTATAAVGNETAARMAAAA